MRGDVPAIGGYHELAAGPVTLHLGSALLGWDAAVSTSSSFPCREGVFADAALSHPRTTEKSGLRAQRQQLSRSTTPMVCVAGCDCVRPLPLAGRIVTRTPAGLLREEDRQRPLRESGARRQP